MHSTPTSPPSGNTVKYFESPNHPENYPNNHSEVIYSHLTINLYTKSDEGMGFGS